MKEAPATGMARASGNVFVGTIDASQIAPRPLEIQTKRVLSRIAVSQSVAAAIAQLAYGCPEGWRNAQ